MTDIPENLERAVLTLVERGGGKASWHFLATRLPSFDVPFVPDLMTVLKELRACGLVTRELVEGGMDRWALTIAGEARLRTLDRWVIEIVETKGPLSPRALADFVSAVVRPGIESTFGALRPFIGDEEKLAAILRQMLAAYPREAQRVAELALFLPMKSRVALARELVDDPRAEVRAALFRGWTPVKTDVPGQPLPTVDEAELDALLHRGLTDASPVVREAAAALAFLAVRGGALSEDLRANLAAPERNLRWWCILALGAARDRGTREALSEIFHGEDVAMASAAARALGQRHDAVVELVDALSDPREEVQNAAWFALETVAEDVPARALDRFADDPRPHVRRALAGHHRRTARGPSTPTIGPTTIDCARCGSTVTGSACATCGWIVPPG